MKKVYLAGRIEDITWEESSTWRKKVVDILDDTGIRCYNSCDHVPIELRNGVVSAQKVVEFNGLKGNEIFAQDIFHLRQCNIFLANLKDVNTGTLVELGMAYILGKLIIVFDVSHKLKLHPFINQTANIIYDKLDDALDFIIRM